MELFGKIRDSILVWWYDLRVRLGEFILPDDYETGSAIQYKQGREDSAKFFGEMLHKSIVQAAEDKKYRRSVTTLKNFRASLYGILAEEEE